MSKPVRPFIDTLRDLEGGYLLDELSGHQHGLVDQIRLTNKPGSLTIVLNYKPDGAGQLSIKADVKVKEPKLARGNSLFFLTPEGNLTRNDPRQQSMDLRPVAQETPMADLRTVADQ